MAIISVNRLANDNSSDGPDSKRLVERYRVICDDDLTTTTEARRASGIPRRGDPHGEETGVRCKTVEADRDEEPRMFIVTATFENGSFAAEDDVPTHPFDEPAEIEWDFNVTTEPVYVDRDGNPIANSAGQVYDPPIEEEFADLILRISRNTADYDPMEAMQYFNSVNSDPFLGANPGQCLMKRRTARNAKATLPDNSLLLYYVVTTEIYFRFEGWARRLVDQGTLEIDTDDPTKLKVIKDTEHYPMNGLMYLDGAGAVLPVGGTPVTKDWNTKRELPFGTLNIL